MTYFDRDLRLRITLGFREFRSLDVVCENFVTNLLALILIVNYIVLNKESCNF